MANIPMDIAPATYNGSAGYVRLRRDTTTTSELDTVTVIRTSASPPAGSYNQVNPGTNNDLATVYTTTTEFNQLCTDLNGYHCTVIVDRTGPTTAVYVAHVKGSPLLRSLALKKVSEVIQAFNVVALRKDIDYIRASVAELLRLAQTKHEFATEQDIGKFYDSEPPAKNLDEVTNIVS